MPRVTEQTAGSPRRHRQINPYVGVSRSQFFSTLYTNIGTLTEETANSKQHYKFTHPDSLLKKIATLCIDLNQTYWQIFSANKGSLRAVAIYRLRADHTEPAQRAKTLATILALCDLSSVKSRALADEVKMRSFSHSISWHRMLIFVGAYLGLLLIICERCNQKKNDKTPTRYHLNIQHNDRNTFLSHGLEKGN
jgi:hypothetical protein